MIVTNKEINVKNIPSRNKNRSRRLQKKLRLGKFQELGFNLRIRFKPEVTEEQKDAFFDKFIEECIEANNLMLGGTYEESFICKEKGSCVLDDRYNVSFYLSKHTDILEATVSHFIDAWYGPFED